MHKHFLETMYHKNRTTGLEYNLIFKNALHVLLNTEELLYLTNSSYFNNFYSNMHLGL